MYKIYKINDNHIDVTFIGKLDNNDMKGFIDEFSSLSEGCKNAALVFRLSDFHVPTLGALLVELSHLPKILTTVHKFDRCAILTDEGWVKNWASVEAALIPGMKIKCFTSKQEEDAVAWATRKCKNAWEGLV